MTPGELCREPWLLDPVLAGRLARTLNQVEQETGVSWRIISGYRTLEEQEQLRRRGRPTAPPGCSTHTVCPARGADVQVNGFPARQYKITFGRLATEAQLRWGGGSPVDPDTGIPSDWNHVDLGPVC